MYAAWPATQKPKEINAEGKNFVRLLGLTFVISPEVCLKFNEFDVTFELQITQFRNVAIKIIPSS